MRLGKAMLLVLVLIIAVAVGVLIGPRVTTRFAHRSEPVALSGPAPAAEPGAPAPARERAARKTVATSDSAAELKREAPRASVSPSEPKLQKALQPLLRRGTQMDKAADGFHNGAQFAAVAHAAHNTDVPFVVLKHRVLDENKSLATAIRESKPDVNARLEANRAWEEARLLVSSLS
jgi:hypothetical protein